MADNVLDRYQGIIETDKEIDASKKVRIGIVGTGWIAEAQIVNYRNA